MTAINYDSLLWLFVGNDEIRPAMMVPNTVGEMVWSTDAHIMIGIPISHLTNPYPTHPKAPNFASVLGGLKECSPINFKTSDLSTVLASFEKEYDTSECKLCEGDGDCPHCGKSCDECSGKGYIKDKNKPMIHTRENGYISVDGLFFSPYYMALIEKVLLNTGTETFRIVKRNSNSFMFKIRDMELVIMRMQDEGVKPKPSMRLPYEQKEENASHL